MITFHLPHHHPSFTVMLLLDVQNILTPLGLIEVNMTFFIKCTYYY